MIISHLKASYLYGFIIKDEKNQGKTEEILLEFVSIFDTARSLPSVIGDVKMEGFDSTYSHELQERLLGLFRTLHNRRI